MKHLLKNWHEYSSKSVSQILEEGQAENLIKKFPELELAYEEGIKNPQYLMWIAKRRGGEPVMDIVDIIRVFDKNKNRIKQKGLSPDIYSYKTPGSLRTMLEELGGSKSKERRRLKEEETTHLGEFGPWVVVMPHTKESSCQLGKGTTWCTAATETQNLFLSYVGRKEHDIVLYYIIERGQDPRKNPDAKLSVGFINGEPRLEGEHGGVSVNAANDGLQKSDLQRILVDRFPPIMDAMRAHAKSIKGLHPAKKQVRDAAKNVQLYQEVIKNLEGDEKFDMIKQVLKYEPAQEVMSAMFDDLFTSVSDIRESIGAYGQSRGIVYNKIAGAVPKKTEEFMFPEKLFNDKEYFRWNQDDVRVVLGSMLASQRPLEYAFPVSFLRKAYDFTRIEPDESGIVFRYVAQEVVASPSVTPELQKAILDDSFHRAQHGNNMYRFGTHSEIAKVIVKKPGTPIELIIDACKKNPTEYTLNGAINNLYGTGRVQNDKPRIEDLRKFVSEDWSEIVYDGDHMYRMARALFLGKQDLMTPELLNDIYSMIKQWYGAQTYAPAKTKKVLSELVASMIREYESRPSNLGVIKRIINDIEGMEHDLSHGTLNRLRRLAGLKQKPDDVFHFRRYKNVEDVKDDYAAWALIRQDQMEKYLFPLVEVIVEENTEAHPTWVSKEVPLISDFFDADKSYPKEHQIYMNMTPEERIAAVRLTMYMQGTLRINPQGYVE